MEQFSLQARDEPYRAIYEFLSNNFQAQNMIGLKTGIRCRTLIEHDVALTRCLCVGASVDRNPIFRLILRRMAFRASH